MQIVNKKIFCLLISASCLLLPAFAKKEDKVKELLDKSSIAFSKAGTMSVYFTLNIKNVPNKVSESFEGVINLNGKKFHLNTSDNEIWFDGKTQWLLQKDYNEIQVSEPSVEVIQTLNPVFIFNLYKKRCLCKFIGERIIANGKKVQEVELIPQTKENGISRIILQIASANYLPVKIHIYYNYNNMENVIHISKYITNNRLTDNHFMFNPKNYPNVEIIDLR